LTEFIHLHTVTLNFPVGSYSGVVERMGLLRELMNFPVLRQAGENPWVALRAE
jgi:hypothetical protein